MKVTHLAQHLEIYVDDEFIGVADCKITDEHGAWYGDALQFGEPEKLQDNGEYVGVNDNNVEVKAYRATGW